MSTAQAVIALCHALREDPSYYDSWKANIAVAFCDQYALDKDGAPFDRREIHAIAEGAADRFLGLLIRP
jgi:Tfp pilus assembly protein PilF